MKKWIPLLCALGLVLLPLAGCDKEPVSPPPPPSGLVRIENESSHEIAIFRYRPTGDMEWGINMIPAGYEIQPNWIQEYYLPPGTFDIRFETPDERTFWTFRNVTVYEDDTYTLTLTD